MSNVEKLARKLIQNLGVGVALKACRENMWAGVAAEITMLSGRRLVPPGSVSH